MKKITTILLVLIAFSLSAQNNAKESWSFGVGISNHITSGDLRSIGPDLDDDGGEENLAINGGAYIYVDKMFNRAFGVELRGFVTSMAGASQELPTSSLNNTRFNGTAKGFEVTTIINLSNLAARPYRTKTRKWNLASYVGMGLQSYDSRWYSNSPHSILADYGDSPSKDGIANSVYYTGGLGLKYKLTKKFDIEFRGSVNLNQDDHLDGAISDKQHLEMFFLTNLGVVYKLNDKNHDNYVWQSKFVEEKKIEEKPDFNKMVNDAVTARLAGMPKFDADRDTDKDGFKDSIDPCPLRYSKANSGCPGDADKDGVLDDIDLCPQVAGLKNNNGCPRPDAVASTVSTAFQTPYISEHVYFALDSAALTADAIHDLNRIIIYMVNNPGAYFTLEGNTDKGGGEAYNLNLSERRSNAVKKYLVSKGINENNLEIVSLGDTQPKFENTIVNKLNRRVDITLK